MKRSRRERQLERDEARYRAELADAIGCTEEELDLADDPYEMSCESLIAEMVPAPSRPAENKNGTGREEALSGVAVEVTDRAETNTQPGTHGPA